MAIRFALPILLLLTLAGCDLLPRDPDGTLDHIRQTKIMRIGTTDLAPDQRPVAVKIIATLAHQTGAKPRIFATTTEPGFAALDEGRLDLLLTPVDEDSPWAKEVAFGPPLARSGSKDHPITLVAAMKNG